MNKQNNLTFPFKRESISGKSIVITGACGYLGSQLTEYFRNKNNCVFPFDRQNNTKNNCFMVDITDKAMVKRIIQTVKPDIVIHAAAISNLIKCEEDQQLATNTNIVGTRNIISAIKSLRKKCKLVFISSDYVFDGRMGNYKEHDKRQPKTFYGQTKKISEDEICKALDDYIICRTANVFGRGGNFFIFLSDSLNSSKETEYFDDMCFTPTYIEYFLQALAELICIDYSGVIHIAGKEKLSRYSFAIKAAKTLGKDLSKIKPIHLPKNSLIAKNSSLDTCYSRKIITAYCPSIEQALYCHFNGFVNPYLYVSDSRGCIQGINQGDEWREINYIETKSGVKRGGHFHKTTKEAFFIIDGRIKITLQRIREKKIRQFIVKKKDCFVVEPGTIHTFETLTKAKWINMLSHPMTGAKKDFYEK